MVKEGAFPDLIQVGNEIINGICLLNFWRVALRLVVKFVPKQK